MDNTKIGEFLEILGMTEQPYGVYYSDEAPDEAITPKPGPLPSVEAEAKGQVDWKSIYENFSCVIGVLWRARKKGAVAYFDRDHFGCLGGAFYLGFLKPQLEAIVHYVSTGIPNQREGEHYLESPEVTRNFFNTMDPRPSPRRYCVFKPVNMFSEGERPELVVFFARAETIAGLNQLATFVTNDFEAVRSPFGAGCTNIVTWPLKYLAQGELKAVVGGWDPSDRKFMKPDELTFSMPVEMFEKMLDRWKESFLTTPTWAHVKKRIERSRRAWGEE
ncbi:MAG: DUF169 domain-containing protein [Desulfomonile tiedjei]|uniref:DUF169 domain-containing protein n=1 Tax=Desulfomonile tiedjei TaxID=2358 RepID=A0A9D6V3X0_9BACT|nr:DUF169 domain-containing protein [Desulfomonile tiedjei]